MQRRTSPLDNVPINGANNQAWFEQNFGVADMEIEDSVAFAVADLNSLLAQPDCNEIVFSKQVHNGKKTLAVAGIDSATSLQVSNFQMNGVVVEHLVLIGTHHVLPKSTASFTLDFSGMKAHQNHAEWTTIYNSTGPFNDLVKRYNEKKRIVNFFSTVNFAAADIRLLIAGNPLADKVAFIPGFATLKTEIKATQPGTGRPSVTSMTNLETLIAVAVDNTDNVLGSPVIADFPWPVKWKPYS